MLRNWLFVAAPIVLLAGNQPWKEKKIPEWTEDDAKIVIAESPWAKSVTPAVTAPPPSSRSSMPGGVRIGGMGIPGGYPRSRGGYPRSGGGGGRQQQRQSPSVLMIRWESALPMREAELKARDTSAPTIDDDHYALAVYGVPRQLVSADDKGLASTFKKHAVIKRDGKKDFKPSSVLVLHREDGPVIVYLFPRSTELTKSDRRIEFDGEIGSWKFSAPFFTDDMVFEGKLEL